MAFQTSHRGITAHINMTPMIDVLLVLLIIFMVIAPSHPTGLPVALPQAATESHGTPEEPIVIEVGADRSIRINRNLVGRSMLAGELRRILESRGDRTMFLRGAGELEFGAVAEVIDAARTAGVYRTALLTDRDALR